MKNDIIHTLEKGDVRVEDIEMDDSLKGLLITFGAYFTDCLQIHLPDRLLLP